MVLLIETLIIRLISWTIQCSTAWKFKKKIYFITIFFFFFLDISRTQHPYFNPRAATNRDLLLIIINLFKSFRIIILKLFSRERDRGRILPRSILKDWCAYLLSLENDFRIRSQNVVNELEYVIEICVLQLERILLFREFYSVHNY